MDRENLQLECNKILQNSSIAEDDRIDAVEVFVKNNSAPNMPRDQFERLVLDILWTHRENKPGHLIQKARVISVTNSNPIKVPPKPVKASKDKKKTWISLDDLSIAETPTPVIESPYDLLRKTFGNDILDEDIDRLLAHNDFDIGRTVEMLINSDAKQARSENRGQSTTSEPITILTRDQPASRVVCKYFVQTGNCLRGSDCMYAHDISQRICRFWLQGRCLAGENCTFIHTVPESVLEKLDRAQPAPQKAPPQLDTTLLPKLGDKGPRKLKTNRDTVPYERSFDPNIISKTLPIAVNKDVTVNKSTLVMRPAMRLPWEHLGFGEYQQYVDLRESARKYGELRNRYLQLATDSWANNDPATAKALSKKGQGFNQKMIQDYREAAVLLRKQSLLPNSDIFLDLHGLEIGAAIDYLEESLLEIQETEKHAPRLVYIISGRGHYKVKSYLDHLTQQVRLFLNERGYMHKKFGEVGSFGHITGVDVWSSLC